MPTRISDIKVGQKGVAPYITETSIINQFFLSTHGCLIVSFRYILINSGQFALEFIGHLAGIKLAFYYARRDQDNQFVFGFIIGCTSKQWALSTEAHITTESHFCSQCFVHQLSRLTLSFHRPVQPRNFQSLFYQW